MARREASGQRGDLLVDQIAGGLTLDEFDHAVRK